MNSQLTIVIPCKNEGRGVIDVLRLIRKQRLDCLIIVADSSSEEGSRLILEKYQKASPMTVKIVKGGFPAEARNNGAKHVKTPYVLFMDADIHLKDDFVIQHCLKVAIGGDYDLVTCKFNTIEVKYRWIYRLFDIVQWFSSKTKPFAVGGFMLFKTSTFRKLGGFVNEDRIAEDYHLSSKVKPNKFKITDHYVYTPGRRFENKGIWYMFKLAWVSWLNRNNDEWFKNNYNYWE
jgi:glycosyltransferase involved in cell wall biosynthesis